MLHLKSAAIPACSSTSLSQGVSLLALAAAAALATAPAHGQVVVDGQTITVPSSQQSPWNIGGYLVVGQNGSGTLAIEEGGAVTNSNGYIGQSLGSNGVVTVTGTGSTWNNGLDDGNLYVGEAGAGTLVIDDGGAVTNSLGYIGHYSGSNGAVTVTGAGSAWNNSSNFYIGDGGTGTLAIEDSGTVANSRGYIGMAAGSSGAVTVTGAGSTWTNDLDLHIGERGNGTLVIQDGGVVANSVGRIGYESGSNGAVTVTGAGSTWANGRQVVVGFLGPGILTVKGGGTVSSEYVSVGAASSGTLRLEGGAGGSGVLETGQVRRGSGNASVVFDGGTLRLTGNQSSLFSFFWAGEVNLAAGGALIDTQGFNAAAAIGIVGTGGLEKLGTGTLRLTGANTYAGGTTVSGGTLQVGNGGTTGSVTGNVVNDSVLAFNRSDAVTFAGTISGSGAVQQVGSGTTILTGANTYMGDTTISAGTLQVGNGGVTGSITGNVVNDSVLTFNRSDTMSFAGNISGSGAVQQVGSGTLTLSGTNAYSGTTRVEAGTLRAGAANAFSGVTAHVVGAGGVLDLAGHDQTIGSLAGGGEVLLGAATLTAGDSTSTRFSGTVSGSGSLVKAGTGRLTLTGANTYTGGTTVAAGSLQLGDADYQGTIVGDVTIASLSALDIVNADTSAITSIANSGNLHLYDASAAGSATITNGNTIFFYDQSTADRTAITNNGGIFFWDDSTAGDATIANSNTIFFRYRSTAGNAVITNNGGSISFLDNSTAGNAAISIGGTGEVDFSWTSGPLGDHRISAGSIAGTGSYLLGGNELTVGGNGRSTEVAGVISGAGGSLVKTGTGTLTLSGANTFSGTTRVEAGTLRAGAANAFSGASGHVVGAGAVLDLAGHDQAIGSLAGGGEVLLGAATLTAGSDNTSTSFSGTVSGSGSLVKTDSGTLTLNGTNTYTGGTTVAAGMLQMGDADDQGAIVGEATVAFNAMLKMVNADTGGLTGITNTGTVAFQVDSSAGSATIANAGIMCFEDSSTAGSATIANTGLACLVGNSTTGSASITNDNVLLFLQESTGGQAAIANNQFLDFIGTSTAGSARIANTHALAFSETSSAGNATITNSGTTHFNHDSTAGNARLIGVDGSFDFSGLTGPGTTAGSIEGAGEFLLGSKSLTVGSNNLSTIVTGTIADGGKDGGSGGSLVKVGTGTLTLAGSNAYTGPTTILGGLLNITGSLAGTIDVSGGGKLGGTGSLGTVTLGDGGIVSPGNSIGAMTMATLTTGAGAFYDVELIDGGNTAGVHSDLIEVTGLATINPGLIIRAMPENGTDDGSTYVPGTVYTILTTTAPGDLTVNGTPEVSDSFAFLNFTGSHDTQNFYLTSELAATSFCLPGASANQCGVGDAAFAQGRGNGVFDAMVGLDESGVAAALDSMSGEVHASVQSVIDATAAQFEQTLSQRAGGLSGGSGGFEKPGVVTFDGPALNPAYGAAWLAPVGGGGNMAANANSAALDWWSGGLAGGYEWTDNGTVAGLALGYQRGAAAVPARQSQSTMDSFMVGAYGTLTNGGASLAGILSLGTGHISTSRAVTVGGTTSQASADYWGQFVGLSLEAAHGFDIGNGTTISPLATIDFGWSGHGGFAETGAGAFNLTAAATGALHLETGIGLGISHVIATDEGAVTLDGRVVWEHRAVGGAAAQTLAFGTGTSPFTVQGASPDIDRLGIGAGLTYQASAAVTLSARYDGSFGASGHTHKVGAALNVQF